MNLTRISNRVRAMGATASITLVALAAVAVGNPAIAHDDIVRCEDMPHLWTGATEIEYRSEAHTVHFVWQDGSHAAVPDDGPGCASQPGLGEQLQGIRGGAVTEEQAACRDLRHLVDAVRAERRAQDLGQSGGAQVSDNAQAAAARKGGTPPGAAVQKRRGANRTINLDYADQVLRQCPR